MIYKPVNDLAPTPKIDNKINRTGEKHKGKKNHTLFKTTPEGIAITCVLVFLIKSFGYEGYLEYSKKNTNGGKDYRPWQEALETVWLRLNQICPYMQDFLKTKLSLIEEKEVMKKVKNRLYYMYNSKDKTRGKSKEHPDNHPTLRKIYPHVQNALNSGKITIITPEQIVQWMNPS